MMVGTDLEDVVTNLSGIVVVFIGLLGLVESLLQFSLVGDSQLPLVKGSTISLFSIGFGLVLLTEGASTALRKLKNSCF